MNITTETVHDPYPEPFPWSDTMPHEAPEHRLFNPLPCPMRCESGWLPTVEGGWIKCFSCCLVVDNAC